MKDKEKDRTLLFIIICVIVLIIGVVGVSYAAVFYSKTGEKVNKVTTGTMTMSYSENTNGINLTNAFPISDSMGMALNESNQYFDFTISVNMGGDSSIDYVISAGKESDSTLPDNAVKVYLTSLTGGNESQVLAPTKISDLQLTSNMFDIPDGQFILYQGSFNKIESRNYRLRMWVASDYVLPGISQTYKLRVNVYGNAVV